MKILVAAVKRRPCSSALPTARLGQADPNTPMRNSSNAAAVAASAADLENLPAMVNAAAVTAANFENLPALDKVVMDHDPSAQQRAGFSAHD
jgi:hypothetical protein